MLSLVVGGAERAHELLSSALRASGHRDLPREPAALCGFARAHLTYGLIDELGPRLAATVIDELTRELLRGHSEGDVSPSNEDDDHDDDGPSSTVRSVDGKSTALGRIATTRRRVNEEIVSGVRSAKSDRPRVAIVEPNAFVRASLSRALVRAGLDVLAIDKVAELQGDDRHAAVLVSLRAADAEASLTAVLALDPTPALVAYFADESNHAVLRRVAPSAVVVSALSPLDQVVASVAALVDLPPPSSRGSL